MKFFIAYKATGEDKVELEKTIRFLCSGLESARHSYYCTFWEEESFQDKSKKEMMKHAFKEIDNSDALLVFLNSENKSEGMLMEVGYCLAHEKRIILIINNKIKNTYLRDIANQVIEFNNLEDINQELGKIE